MVYKVSMFNNVSDLVKFLNVGPIASANIVQIYYDAASGKHIVVYHT